MPALQSRAPFLLMRFFGSRRARGIILILVAVLAIVLWHASNLYAKHALRNLAPTLISQLEERLQRKIRMDRLLLDRPGRVLAEGVQVSQRKTLESGVLLTARRIELTYNPALLTWQSLWTRGAGLETRATLRVTGIELNRPNPFPLIVPHKHLLTADSLKTDFDLGPLLRGTGEVLPTVRRLELGKPTFAALRRPDGTWDLTETLKGKDSGFRGEFVARDARVSLTDLAPGALPRPQRQELSGDFTLQFAAAPVMRFSARGRTLGAQLASFEATGTRDGSTRRWFAAIRAETPAIPYWYRYFVKDGKNTEVLGGGATVSGVVWDDHPAPGSKAEFRLDLDIRNGSARVAGLPAPFRAFNGRISSQRDLLTLAGAADLGGVPLRLSGDVLIGPRGRATWSLASDRVDLPKVASLFPDLKLPEQLSIQSPLGMKALLQGENGVWTTRGELKARGLQYQDLSAPETLVTFEGRFGEGLVPELKGGFRTPGLSHPDAQLTALSGRYEWKDGLVHASGQAEALGGSASVQGWVRFPEQAVPEFYLTGSLSHVQVVKLPWKSEDLDLAGVGGAEFVLSGTQESPRVSAFVRGTSLSIQGEPIDELTARVRLDGETLVVENAVVRDRRGEATLVGRIGPEQKIDLRVSAQGVDLARLLGKEAQVEGQATLGGRVTGTFKEPNGSGTVQVYHPVFGQRRADYLEANFEARDSFVQLSRLKLLRAPAAVSAEQLVISRGSEKAPWQVEGRLEVEGLSAGRAVLLANWPSERLREWPVSGEVSRLTVDVSGALKAPSVRFEGEVGDAAVRRIDLGRLRFAGSFETERRRLELTSLTSTAPAGELTASGTLEFPPDEERAFERTRAQITFRAKGLRIAPLIASYRPQIREYAAIRGSAEVSGAVSGSLAEPRLSFDQVTLADLVVNGVPVELEPLRVQVLADTLIIRDVGAKVGEGTLTLPYLGISLAQREGEQVRWTAGAFTARAVPLSVLIGVLEASPAITEEQRDWLELFDRWAERRGALDASLKQPGLAGGSPTDDQIRAQLAGRASPPALSGDLRVEGLEPAPGLGKPATLVAEFSTVADGFELSRFRFDQEEGVQVTIAGRSDGKGPNGPRLDYTAQVTGANLTLLGQIPSGELRERLQPLQPLRGVFSGSVQVTGTQKLPELSFSAEVQNPIVAGIPLDRAGIQKATYSAALGRLQIGSGVLSKRPSPGAPEASVKISGHLPVSWPDLGMPPNRERDVLVEFPQQPLSVLNALASDADRLAQQLDYELPEGRERFTHLFGQVLAPEGSIEGRVRLAGTANTPNNSGSLSVASQSVRIRGIGPTVKQNGWHLPGWLASEIASSEPLLTSIQDFRLRVELVGDTVRLAELSGKSSHGGSFSGGGDVTLGRSVNAGPAARLNLRLSVDDFRINEKEAARALGAAYQGTQVKATLTSVTPGLGSAKRPIRITGDWPNVLVSGAVRVEDASLPLALDTPSAEKRTPMPENVSLNLAILPGKEVWLRNPLVRLQLEPPTVVAGRTEGHLTVTNRLSAPVVQGTLRASHGVFNLPLIRLRNAEGVIRVAYDGRVDELNVQQPSPVYLDLAAETTLRIQRAPTVEAEYYDATFEIRGAPGAGGTAGIRSAGVETGLSIGAEGGLTVTVRTDPPLPSREIEALIRQQYAAEGFGPNGTNVVEALRGQIEQAFAVNVASEFTGRVEDIVRSALGLNIFSVDFGVSQPLRVRIGKRLFGPVYGTVAQSFGNAQDQVQRRYEVYYRLSPQFRVGYRQEDPLGRKVFFFSGSASF